MTMRACTSHSACACGAGRVGSFDGQLQSAGDSGAAAAAAERRQDSRSVRVGFNGARPPTRRARMRERTRRHGGSNTERTSYGGIGEGNKWATPLVCSLRENRMEATSCSCRREEWSTTRSSLDPHSVAADCTLLPDLISSRRVDRSPGHERRSRDGLVLISPCGRLHDQLSRIRIGHFELGVRFGCIARNRLNAHGFIFRMKSMKYPALLQFRIPFLQMRRRIDTSLTVTLEVPGSLENPPSLTRLLQCE
jgi:hypothetical protein